MKREETINKLDLFHFRHFSMQQAPSGQRINTDSCVFGAVVADHTHPSRIIDIGTGTGVLGLMFAQRFPEAQITAVEPVEMIAAVADINFKQPFAQNRTMLLTLRAQELKTANLEQFDLVVCNPPYFQNSQLSVNRQTAVARHNFDLTPHDLFVAMLPLMTEDGNAWISYPTIDEPLWIEPGQACGLHLLHKITVRDYPEAKSHITIVGWTKTEPTSVTCSEITYRVSHQGKLSPWMFRFREYWYPDHYNAQFYT